MGESKGKGVVRGEGHCDKGLIRNVVSSEPSKRFVFMFSLVFLGLDVEREGRKTRKGGMENEHSR